MALPDSFIEELILKNDIVDLISSYVSLRSRGRTHVGLCPFHNEKTPSFHVYPDTNSFFCFGCQAGGDVITFIKKAEHLDYMDAVRFLADRAGMDMPKQDASAELASNLRRRVLEANRETARFYHEQLFSENGNTVLDYYHRRGYSDRTIRHFGLGYAPNGSALYHHLRKKGYRDDELLQAGLIRKSQKGYFYDNFYDRAIIPIIDVRGNVIGFGGRALVKDAKQKYINTSDTPVFKKTNNLFALNFAKDHIAKNDDKRLILCEGYMDVIALHQAGFTNAVASLGTAVTPDHARLISRYAEEIILLLDSDAAGQNATNKAINVFRTTGMRIKVARIPNGKDPDEFLKNHAPEALKLVLDRAVSDVDYLLAATKQNYIVDSDEGKLAYLQKAVETIAKLSNPMERDIYISRLAKELSVSKTAITQQTETLMRKKQKEREKRKTAETIKRLDVLVSKVNPEALKNARAASAEDALIGALLLHPDRIKAVAALLPSTDMITSFNRRLYDLLVKRSEDGLLIDFAVLAAYFNEDEMAQITSIYRAAQTRGEALEDLERYIDIIRHERSIASASSFSDMSDDEARRMMELLRQMKQ